QGYLQEATTINECMHTFCRPCIESFLCSSPGHGLARACPLCQTILEPRALALLRPDRLMQNVIEHLVHARTGEDTTSENCSFSSAEIVHVIPAEHKASILNDFWQASSAETIQLLLQPASANTRPLA